MHGTGFFLTSSAMGRQCDQLCRASTRQLEMKSVRGTRREKLQRAKNAGTIAIQQWKQRNGKTASGLAPCEEWVRRSREPRSTSASISAPRCIRLRQRLGSRRSASSLTSGLRLNGRFLESVFVCGLSLLPVRSKRNLTRCRRKSGSSRFTVYTVTEP